MKGNKGLAERHLSIYELFLSNTVLKSGRPSPQNYFHWDFLFTVQLWLEALLCKIFQSLKPCCTLH